MLLKIPDTQTAKLSQILGFEGFSIYNAPPSFRLKAAEIIILVIIVLLYFKHSNNAKYSAHSTMATQIINKILNNIPIPMNLPFLLDNPTNMTPD